MSNILGTIEILDSGYLFRSFDGKTSGFINSDSLFQMLTPLMAVILVKGEAGERYSLGFTKIE